MPPQASLLGIPLEVRTMIILDVAFSPISSPPKVSDLNTQGRRTLQAKATGAWEESRRVLFPARPAANPCLSLLLTNRRLRDETLDALRRAAATKPLTYTADIVYIKNDCTLYPTWLSVPARAEHVDTIYAQFRIFNRPESTGGYVQLDKDPHRGMFSIGCGAPPAIVWPFYHLLVGILTSGTHGPCGAAFTVKKLILDFLPPAADEVDGLLPLGKRRRRVRAGNPGGPETRVDEYFGLPDELKGRCMGDPRKEAAAMLMCFVHQRLWYLAQLSAHTFEYGKRLHEHIGVVEVRLDGEAYANIDLGQLLANVKRWGTDESSYSSKKWCDNFVPWKPVVVARRQGLGMSVGN